MFGYHRWLRTVETVGRQYAFIKFDRVIQKRRRDYLDPNSSANLKKLNDDLQSIHNIMRKTIDDVLDRGNKLDGVLEVLCAIIDIICFSFLNIFCVKTRGVKYVEKFG
jgi:vesicle transport protein SEC22